MRALGTLKLASRARSAFWECARDAGRFFNYTFWFRKIWACYVLWKYFSNFSENLINLSRIQKIIRLSRKYIFSIFFKGLQRFKRINACNDEDTQTKFSIVIYMHVRMQICICKYSCRVVEHIRICNEIKQNSVLRRFNETSFCKHSIQMQKNACSLQYIQIGIKKCLYLWPVIYFISLHFWWISRVVEWTKPWIHQQTVDYSSPRTHVFLINMSILDFRSEISYLTQE